MGTACFACITLAAGALDAYQTLQSVALQFDTCTAAVNRSCQPVDRWRRQQQQTETADPLTHCSRYTRPMRQMSFGDVGESPG